LRRNHRFRSLTAKELQSISIPRRNKTIIFKKFLFISKGFYLSEGYPLRLKLKVSSLKTFKAAVGISSSGYNTRDILKTDEG